jgi:hypothetical protein
LNQPKYLPDFATYQERDEYFKKHADYFTVVAKHGMTYERMQYNTLEDALKAAHTKATIAGGGWMIYAVIGHQSAFVQAVKPKGDRTGERNARPYPPVH